nr:hypothetical protein KV8917_1020001 [Klebsiella variicola]
MLRKVTFFDGTQTNIINRKAQCPTMCKFYDYYIVEGPEVQALIESFEPYFTEAV